MLKVFPSHSWFISTDFNLVGYTSTVLYTTVLYNSYDSSASVAWQELWFMIISVTGLPGINGSYIIPGMGKLYNK